MLKLNQVHHGDCLEVMKDIDDESIDLIITSPPYNNWRNKRTQRNRDSYWKSTNIVYDNYSDKMTDSDYIKLQINVINECIRILKSTGTMCYNHKDRIYNFEVFSPLQWILKTVAVYRQRITWDRCSMLAYNPVRFYRVEEDIYILGKKAKGFKWNKDTSKYLSIWRISPSSKEFHPASFPIEIPNRCIEAFTTEGDCVLDPFAGSGTTLVAASTLGRNFIGIDCSEKYCKIARQRIENPDYVKPTKFKKGFFTEEEIEAFS